MTSKKCFLKILSLHLFLITLHLHGMHSPASIENSNPIRTPSPLSSVADALVHQMLKESGEDEKEFKARIKAIGTEFDKAMENADQTTPTSPESNFDDTIKQIRAENALKLAENEKKRKSKTLLSMR